MTKRLQPPPPPPLSTPQQTSLDIAINLLLRCEHFMRSLAFLDFSTSEQTTKKLQKLCSDFHETLFIIDLSLHKYRTEHRFNGNDAADADAEAGYRAISEINEQLTDFAFLVGQGVHPWDVPYRIDSSQQQSSSASDRRKKDVAADQIKFLPATWKNRVLRQTTTPLAGFSLEESA